MNKYFRRAMAVVSVMCLVVLSGCGKSNVQVSGRVTYKGQPVTGGALVFSPVTAGKDQEPGKPVAGVINGDGSFALATSKGTGAQAGKHRVTFTPPAQNLTEEQRTNPNYVAPMPPYMGLVPQQVEVEVTTGMEDMEIELVDKVPAGR
jgi:hypothetical protein